MCVPVEGMLTAEKQNMSSLTLYFLLEGVVYHFNILVFPLLRSNCVKIIF